MSFERALPDILAYEGGAVDDPDDHGGRTNHGITQKTYSAWLAKQSRPDADVFDISSADVETIYKQEYWLAGHCNALPWPVSYVHFDSMVQHKPAVAKCMLQRAAGVMVDSIIGPQTMKACFDDPQRVAERLCDEREQLYRRLAERPGQQKFLKGWLSRLEKVRRVVHLARAA